VFTPYSKKWKSKLNDFYLKEYPTEKYIQNLYKIKLQELPSLEDMGFIYNDTFLPSIEIPTNIIAHYDKTRNFPALKGTSTLGIHLRFGTISIRKLANIALANNEQFLNELIWRDFYQMILFNFPHVVHNAFKKQYDAIKWRTDEKDFEAWCEGKTGYPIVDAGMRELNNTGYMHNRVRMIVASFLTKHLLIDWRWGEAYFAQKLIDFELASNNGGWQWASGSGTDAAPYFRIFSPSEQTKKFDDKLQYIRKWIPELDSLNYPQPIVDHKYARERCLKVYKEGLEKK
jgi:deoxyribodipyrimidine photo-lyase